MISAETVRRIGDRLERLIEQGIVDRYEAILEIANMRSYFPREILTKFIEFCKGSEALIFGDRHGSEFFRSGGRPK